MVFWLEDIKRPWLSSDAYNSYKNCVYRYIIPQLGKLRMIKLNRMHIMAIYRYTVERSPSVARILGSVIQVSLRYAQNEHYIYKDPSAGIRLPKKIKDDTQALPEEVLSPEKACVLLAAGRNTVLYLPMLFAALMGLRRSEIIGLKYSDIDVFTGTLHVQRQLGSDPHKDKNQMSHGTKTTQEIRLKTPSSTRVLKIPQIVLQAIIDEQIRNERRKEQLNCEDMDYICCSKNGRPRSRGYFWKPFKALLLEAGLPDIRWHSLRHSYATLLQKEEIGKNTIAQSLGHSKSILAMDVYTDKRQLRDSI